MCGSCCQQKLEHKKCFRSTSHFTFCVAVKTQLQAHSLMRNACGFGQPCRTPALMVRHTCTRTPAFHIGIWVCLKMGETPKMRFWMEPIWGLTLRFKHILERLFSDKPTNLKAGPCRALLAVHLTVTPSRCFKSVPYLWTWHKRNLRWLVVWSHPDMHPNISQNRFMIYSFKPPIKAY